MLVVALTAVVLAAPLGDNIKVSGKGYKLSEGVDGAMCKAVVAEMVEEVRKHDLKRDGEEEIFDTAGMAICLGVVRNYAMEKREKSGRWGLRRKTDAEKQVEEEGGLGVDFEGMLLLKEACFKFADELQQEVSEVVYKKVSVATAEEISKEFCPGVTKPKKKVKKKTAKKAAAAAPEPDMMQQYQKFMNEMQGGDGSMYDMIKQDRDAPETTLPQSDQQEIASAEASLRCSVCKIAVATAHSLSGSRRDEARASEAVQSAFFGVTDNENMDYKPGNPPEWSQDYVLARKKSKKGTAWSLRRSPSQAEELSYTDKIKRNVVVAQACRRSFETDADLGEMIVLHADWSSDSLGDAFCKHVCPKATPQDEL